MHTKEQSLVFQELMKVHQGILFKVARTYCKAETDRQDLVQEMMIQLWQAFGKYNDQFKFTTWMYRIALNVAISFYRKNQIRNTISIPLDDQMIKPEEQDNSAKELQLNLLEQFISELKELDKALMLLYLENKSHAEIAEIIGISTGNVGTKIMRIKDKLKQKFSNQKIN